MEFKDLFKKYEPPPGGLEALRTKLEDREKEEEKKSIFLRPACWAITGVALALLFIAALLIAQLILPSGPWKEKDFFSRLAAQSDDPSLVRYGLVKAPEEAVTVPKKDQTQLAVLRIPVESEDVIFYWVSSLPSDQEFEEE